MPKSVYKRSRKVTIMVSDEELGEMRAVAESLRVDISTMVRRQVRSLYETIIKNGNSPHAKGGRK